MKYINHKVGEKKKKLISSLIDRLIININIIWGLNF